ncbi:MAG: PIG-L deacetylase family protein [Anaerolineae bacterium]
MTEEFKPERALVIVAHPDDPEFSAGGTVAKWTDEGIEVTYIIVTDGSKGTDDTTITKDELVATRVKEQQAAANVLGVRNVVFLGHTDGEIVPDLALRRELVKVIRQYRPDIVVTGDPQTLITSFNTINHPDHRAVGLATLDAIFPAARNHNYFPESLGDGLEPVYVKQVYLSGTLAPDTWVDVTNTFERKIASLREHKSQIKDMDGLAQRMRERMRTPESTEEAPSYREGFRLLKL